MLQATRVFFIRHADCDINVYAGARSNPPLSEVGKKQVEALSFWAKNADIDKVYSSPLVRAMDTAKGIAMAKGLEVNPIDALKELDFGEWEGLSASDIPAEERERWYHEPLTTAPPGGETLTELAKRVLSAYRDITDSNVGKNIAIVAHGGPLRTIICSILGLHLSFLWNFELAHASVSAADIYPNGYSLLVFLNNTYFREGFFDKKG
ncbi:histidine phosphatase family protein [Spirochaetia bacterium 38H-sp]|uniref:Histidine phosphatase family protein n=1 Tax=Rarispira pelagica TaxID=3141764 RepID=A0ABU9UB56_9SPIR